MTDATDNGSGTPHRTNTEANRELAQTGEANTTELRTLILSVDTTFDLGDKKTEAFLPPNFYIDRLVAAIETIIAREKQEFANEHFKECVDTGTCAMLESAQIARNELYSAALKNGEGKHE